MVPTGVSLKHRILRFPLFLPKAFHLVNAANPSKENAYGQTKGEVCKETGRASIGQDRTKLAGHSADLALTTQSEGETFVTCGKLVSTNRRRVTAISLARLAFGLLRQAARHPQQIEVDPIRTFSFSNHILPAAKQRPAAPICVAPLHVSALSPSLNEIHANIICNLAGVKFGAIWDISEKPFVLFQDPITTSSLTLPLNDFCVQAVRSHLRASRERFGICEDL
jgi:hypothetical protein